MSVWLSLVVLIIGLFLLTGGAGYLVDGASSLALKMSLSEIVVGLTVVAFGTSTPEFAVSFLASIQNKPDIALGNIIGSSIFNLLLILGVAGIIQPLRTEKNTVWREIPFSFLAVVVLFILCNDGLFSAGANWLSRDDGLVLLSFFVIFLVYTFGIPRVTSQDEVSVKAMTTLKTFLYIVGGLVGLFIGGRLAVSSSVDLAKTLGVSDKLIGLTILAGGTSLPELFTSAVAARKKKFDLALGNVVGSNIFNVFFILGVSTTLTPLSYDPVLNADFALLGLASIVLFVTMFTGKKRTLDRWEAILMVVLFGLYLAFLIARG